MRTILPMHFSGFVASLKGVFEPKSFIFYLFSKCWKNQRKESLWKISFDLYFNIYLVFFSSIFLCYFLFQTLYFLTLKLSSLILSIGSCFCEKNYLLYIVITKCCLWLLDYQDYNLFFILALCLFLLCRGDCVWDRSSVFQV